MYADLKAFSIMVNFSNLPLPVADFCCCVQTLLFFVATRPCLPVVLFSLHNNDYYWMWEISNARLGLVFGTYIRCNCNSHVIKIWTIPKTTLLSTYIFTLLYGFNYLYLIIFTTTYFWLKRATCFFLSAKTKRLFSKHGFSKTIFATKIDYFFYCFRTFLYDYFLN